MSLKKLDDYHFKTVAAGLKKVPGLLFLPFAFPRYFLKLAYASFSNPRLMGELIEHYPHRRWVTTRKFATFIDAGAFIGSSSFAMSVLLPDVRIFAFEPLELNFKALLRNMNSSDSMRAYQVALGDASGEAQINQNLFSASSSILELDSEHLRQYPYAASVERKKVRIARLDEFLPEMQIRSPAMLKIDVQGYELEVLKGAERTLELINSVFLEASFLPLYKKQCSFESINDYLCNRNFQFKGSYGHQYTRSGELIQANLLYCR